MAVFGWGSLARRTFGRLEEVADWLAVAECYCSSDNDFGSPDMVLVHIDMKKDTGSDSFGSDRSAQKVSMEPDVSPVACCIDKTELAYL